MGRTRYIKPGFFSNETLAELSPWHRLLFAGLWGIADRRGRIEDRPKRIKVLVFPWDDVDVNACLNDLAAKGFIARYAVNGVGVVQVSKWLEHQKPHPKEPASTLPDMPETLTNNQSRDRITALPDLSAALPEQDLDLDLKSNGESNGNENGDGYAKRPAPLTFNPHSRPTNLINGSDQRIHGTHGWCDFTRQLCVPHKLHQEFMARGLKSHAELVPWYQATVDSMSGVAVGDDLFVFWRNKFSAWVGNVTSAAKPLSRSEQMIADGNKVLARRAEGKRLMS